MPTPLSSAPAKFLPLPKIQMTQTPSDQHIPQSCSFKQKNCILMALHLSDTWEPQAESCIVLMVFMWCPHQRLKWHNTSLTQAPIKSWFQHELLFLLLVQCWQLSPEYLASDFTSSTSRVLPFTPFPSCSPQCAPGFYSIHGEILLQAVNVNHKPSDRI